MKGRRRCLGYGEFEGVCSEIAGTPWGPYWCSRCDKIRLATLSAQFEEILDSFPPDPYSEATR
jgi:hypothetical protein